MSKESIIRDLERIEAMSDRNRTHAFESSCYHVPGAQRVCRWCGRFENEAVHITTKAAGR